MTIRPAASASPLSPAPCVCRCEASVPPTEPARYRHNWEGLAALTILMSLVSIAGFVAAYFESRERQRKYDARRAATRKARANRKAAPIPGIQPE